MISDIIDEKRHHHLTPIFTLISSCTSCHSKFRDGVGEPDAGFLWAYFKLKKKPFLHDLDKKAGGLTSMSNFRMLLRASHVLI